MLLALGILVFFGVAFGRVAVHPDDPYAYLAESATSYEDWAHRISKVATGGEPVPSPVISLETQEALSLSFNQTLIGPAEKLMSRQSTISCGVNTYTYAPDAAWCVSYLASIGSQGCVIGGATLMCQRSDSVIVGVDPDGDYTSAPCGTVAVVGGRILDICTRSDSMCTGQGLVDGNRKFNVIISHD